MEHVQEVAERRPMIEQALRIHLPIWWGPGRRGGDLYALADLEHRLGNAVAEAGGKMVEGLATDEEYVLFAYGADAETLLVTLLPALEREGLTKGAYAVVRRGG